MNSPSNTQCCTCGRETNGLGGAVAAYGYWFCSQGHFLDWRSQAVARNRRRRVVSRIVSTTLFVTALLAALFLYQRQTESSTVAGALAGALSASVRQTDVSVRPPVIYAVHLTPAADKVADAVVHDEFVTHDCPALLANTRKLAQQHITYGPVTAEDCAGSLATDRRSDAHLVRGSRVLKHSCVDSPLGAAGASLEASECLEYATEGRYVTADNGERVPECTGAFVDVYLKMINDRWYVIDMPQTPWDGSCKLRDVAFWKRRIPWS